MPALRVQIPQVHFKTEEELQFLKKAFKAPHAEALVAGRLAAG